jgi:L,D-transpeptidase ErfK/SrfK
MKRTPFQMLHPAARQLRVFHILVLLLVCWTGPARGATFLLPGDGRTIVGQLQVVTVDAHNTLLDIARHYDLGYEEITVANPGVSIWVPGEGTSVLVPTEFILPPRPWVGIVVNIPQRRLYYFPRHKANEPATVVTFPVGIARPGWPTPLGATRIVAKEKDPSWVVPRDIQAEHRRQGEADFPDYFPPGPNNPMGMLALETGFSQIFIHGTNRPWGVGMKVSHGCVHLYPENAAYLFPRVPVGTPVRIIDQPVMVGEKDDQLYLSVSDPVNEYPGDRDDLMARAMDAVAQYKKQQKSTPAIDWGRVRQVVDARWIVPMPISVGAPSLNRIIAAIRPEKYDFAPYGIEANDASPPNAPR